jgi:hypothetical protein
VSPCQFYCKPHGLSLHSQCTNELRLNLTMFKRKWMEQFKSCKTWSFHCARIHEKVLGFEASQFCWNRAFGKSALSVLRSTSSSLMIEAQKASEALYFDPASVRLIFRERITVIITYSRLNSCDDQPWHLRLSCRNTNLRNTRSLWLKHCWCSSPHQRTHQNCTVSFHVNITLYVTSSLLRL